MKWVWTPGGPSIGKERGLVGKGEVIYNYNTKESSTVTAGKVGKDTVPTNVGEGGMYDNGRDVRYNPILEQYDNTTAIAGNNVDLTDPYGRTFAEQARVYDAQKKELESKRGLSLAKTTRYAKLSSRAKETAGLKNREYQKLIDAENAKLENVLAKQKQQRNLYQPQDEPVMQANCGKDNKYDSGKIPTFARLLPTITGVGAGLAQLAHWGMNPIRKVNTYQQNPFGNRVLNILGSMRDNPYSAVKGALDAERRAGYSIDRSGGMSGSQRYLARVAQGIGNMQNMANIYHTSDQQNKAYQTAYANSLLQEGNSIAQRRQQALQHDHADYVASHGAKTKGIEQSMANIVGQIGSGFQNEFKYRTYQDTLDLYRQEVANKKPVNTWNPSLAYRRPILYRGDDMYYFSD